MARRTAPRSTWNPRTFRLKPRGPLCWLYDFPSDTDLPLPAAVHRRLGNPRFACETSRKTLLATKAPHLLLAEWRDLRIFHATTGRLLQVLRFPETIRDVSWDAEGLQVAVVLDADGSRSSLYRWDRSTDVVSRLAPEIVDGQCLALSPDGSRLVVGRKRGLMSVLEFPEGATVADHAVLAPGHYTPVHAVAMAPDGATAAGWTQASWDQFTECEHAAATLLVVELPGGRQRVRRAPGYRDADPRCGASKYSVGENLEFSSDGKRLRATTNGKTCWTFSAATAKLVKDDDRRFPKLPEPIASAVFDQPRWDQPMALSPDGRLLTADDRVLETETGAVRVLPKCGWWRPMAAFRDQGRELLLVDRSGDYTVLGLETLEITKKGRLTPGSVKVVAPLADPARLLVMAGSTLARFDRETLRELPPRLALGQDEKALLPTWGSERPITIGEGQIFLHDFQGGDRKDLRRAGASFAGAHTGPDDRTVAYFSGRRVAVLDLERGEDLLAVTVRGAYPTAVAFSPSGRVLAAGFSDWRVRLYDLRTSGLLADLPGHTAPVIRLLFDPRADRLFSLGADGLALVWDGTRLGWPRR